MTATGSNFSAGIGGGGSSAQYSTGGAGGTVTIYGGTVTANGSGAGIGGAAGAGMGGGTGGNTTIYGGVVKATGRSKGIGSGDSNASDGTLTLGKNITLSGGNTADAAQYITKGPLENVTDRKAYMETVYTSPTPWQVLQETIDAAPANTETKIQLVSSGGTAANFTSDNAAYVVLLNDSGEAVLSLPTAKADPAPAAQSLTYNGTEQELVTAGVTSDGTIQYKIGSDGTFSDGVPTAKNVGSYEIFYRILASDGFLDLPDSSAGIATISKAALTVKADDLSKTYGDETEPALTYTVNGLAGSDGALNYTLTFSDGTFTVNPKDITGATVALSAESFQYDGTEKSVTVSSGTLSDGKSTVLSDGDYTVSGDIKGTDVKADYTVTVTAKGNYTGTATAKWSITNGTQTGITAADVTVDYDGQPHGITVTGAPSDGTVTYSTSSDGTFTADSPTITNVSDSPKTLFYKVSRTGYNDATGSATVTIAQKAATVTAKDQTVSLNRTIETGVSYAVLSDGVAGDTLSAVTLTASSTATATSDGTITPSEARIVSGTTDVTENYAITYANGRLIVTAAPVYTVTVSNDGNGTGSADPASGVEGTEVTLTAKPNSGYQFKEWQVVSGGVTVENDKFTIGTENVEIRAVFEEVPAETYTVIWRNGDGTELDSKTYEEGEAEPTTDKIPVKAADEQYTYTFDKWDSGSLSGHVRTYRPEFTATPVEKEPEPVPTLRVTAEGWSGAYDGETHSITVSIPNNADITYSEEENGTYQAENPAYKDAGTYTVYYRVTADGYEETTGSETVTITKATLSPTLTLVDRSDTDTERNNWPYRGVAGIPRVTMTRAEEPVTLLGWFVSLFADDGTVTDYGLTVFRYREAGAAAFRDYVAEELEALPVGQYTLRVDVPESRNYYAASAETDFTITKAPHDNEETGPVKVLANAKNLTVDLSAYLVEEAVCTVSGTGGTLVSGTPVVSGGVLRFDAGARGTGSINVRVSSPNYEDYTITVTLTASTTFTLRYDSNGGSEVRTTKERRPGAAYSALPSPTRTGYTFDGWYTERDGGERVTASTKMGSSDTTLYAHWTPVDYTVTLNLSGGTLSASGWTVSGNNAVRTFHVDTPDFTLPEAERAGYSFTGWSKAGKNAALTVTVEQGTLENLTFTAEWQAGVMEGEAEFTRTVDDSGILGIKDVDQDKNTSESQKGSSNGRRGFSLWDILMGIASDIAKAVTGQTDEPQDVSVALKGATLPDMTETPDTELSAEDRRTKQEEQQIKDTAPQNYRYEEEREGLKYDFVDFSLSQTTGGNGAAEPVEETDRTVEIPLRYDMTGRYNPTVYRWHDDASLFDDSGDGGSVTVFRRLWARPKNGENMEDGTVYVSGRGDDTVIYIYSNKFSTYAVVTTDATVYTVFFDTDGGTAVSAQTVKGGETPVKPEQDPVKNGLTFGGWYVRENGEEQAFDFEKDAVTEDITLYAKWISVTPETPDEPVPSGGGGGGSRRVTYAVTPASAAHGTVTLSTRNAASGAKVTITVQPDKGYEASSVTVRTADGKSVTVTKNADGTYTYTQPDSAVTITAEFTAVTAGTEPAPASPYTTDNPAPPAETGVADWLVTEPHTAYISGFGDGTFRPNANITRAQTAVMFYRLLKNQNVTRNTTFTDMDGSEWYADAVYTLSSLGIIQGYADGSFHGNDNISRAAFTAIVSRFAKVGGTAETSVTFSDVPEGHWAHATIARASGYGWIGGYSDGTFRPAAPITRATVTAIINRMLSRSADAAYAAAHTDDLHQFTDVQDPAAWYYYNITEAANGHTFTVTDGKETWTGINI